VMAGDTVTGAITRVGTVHSGVPFELVADDPKVRMTYLGLSREGDQVYVYVQNFGAESCHVAVREVWLAEQTVTGSEEASLRGGELACFVIKLSRVARPGDSLGGRAIVRVGDRQFTVAETMRVRRSFPVEMEVSGPLGNASGAEPFASLMSCPAHAHGPSSEAASQFFEALATLRLSRPNALSRMSICRYDSPYAYYVFGPLPDQAVINTSLLRRKSTYAQPPGLLTSTFHPFQWLALRAKEATMPSGFVAMVPWGFDAPLFVRRYPSPHELRFMVYAAIAGGAKGIMFRGCRTNEPAAGNVLNALVQELRVIGDDVVGSELVPWVTTDNRRVAACALLRGNAALRVFLFDSTAMPSSGERLQAAQETSRLEMSGVAVTVALPDGFTAQSVTRALSGEELSAASTKGAVRFHVTLSQVVEVVDVRLSGDRSVVALPMQPCSAVGGMAP